MEGRRLPGALRGPVPLEEPGLPDLGGFPRDLLLQAPQPDQARARPAGQGRGPHRDGASRSPHPRDRGHDAHALRGHRGQVPLGPALPEQEILPPPRRTLRLAPRLGAGHPGRRGHRRRLQRAEGASASTAATGAAWSNCHFYISMFVTTTASPSASRRACPSSSPAPAWRAQAGPRLHAHGDLLRAPPGRSAPLQGGGRLPRPRASQQSSRTWPTSTAKKRPALERQAAAKEPKDAPEASARRRAEPGVPDESVTIRPGRA